MIRFSLIDLRPSPEMASTSVILSEKKHGARISVVPDGDGALARVKDASSLVW